MPKEPKVNWRGYVSITPESVGPGYVKPGKMSDRLKGGINGGGEAQQEGHDPLYDSGVGFPPKEYR